MSPPRKKAKRGATSAAPAILHDSVQDNTPCHLLQLPVEILAEMLAYTRIPDLLSLARTSKYFCGILCDPRSSFIWRRVRIDPDFLFVIPDPPPNMPEPAYAAMIFDPGKCYFCKEETTRMFWSYASRVRLCSAPGCTRKWETLHPFWGLVGSGTFTTLANETVFLREEFKESGDSLLHRLALCGSVHLIPLEIWDDDPSSPHAKYLTEQLKPAIRAFAKKYLQVKGDPQAVNALIDEYIVQKEVQSQRYQQLQRLNSWTRKYEALREQINHEHSQHFQSFAAEHCLQMSYMEKSVTFSRVRQLCICRLEEPTLKVMEPYMECIIEETDVITQRSHRRAQEHRLSARREDIKKYYKDYDAPVLPNLQVFRSLPILQALQRKDAAESIREDLQSGAITTSVHDQLEQWVRRTKVDVMKLLGYGKGAGFKPHRPHASKVHPLERATALFQCKECRRVGSSHSRMAALDFKGLCAHECIQPALSAANRTKWSPSNFELASNAIATARAALDALDRADDTTGFADLKGEWFRCKLCPYGVRDMEFEDLLRHCQRHTTRSVAHTGGRNRPQHTEPAKRLRKIAELMSRHHQREVLRHQFTCAHCRFRKTRTGAGAEPTWVEVETLTRMDFNGLRCHLRGRHKVDDVRNEDYYWLPWDESKEPSKKDKEANKAVSPPLPSTAPEPDRMEEDVVPDTAYLLHRRRAHAKLHFCRHCPGEPISSSAPPRGFDWQGLTAHMKARHSIDKPADAIDYEMRDRDQSPTVFMMPNHR